jgi:hypothetical protein
VVDIRLPLRRNLSDSVDFIAQISPQYFGNTDIQLHCIVFVAETRKPFEALGKTQIRRETP